MTAPRRLEIQHRLHVQHHRIQHRRLVAFGIPLALDRRGFERESGRDIAEPEVVGRGLIGEHVGHDATPHQLGQHLRDVADQPDRQGASRVCFATSTSRSASSRLVVIRSQ